MCVICSLSFAVLVCGVLVVVVVLLLLGII